VFVDSDGFDYQFCQFLAINRTFNFRHQGEPMVKRPTLLICVLSFAFAFAQQVEPREPQSQQGDRKVNAEQVTDDTIQLMRQDIRSQRKQIVAANLPLTEAESIKFWPAYDRYVVDHSKIYDTRYALIKEYAKNYNAMTEDQARSFITRWTKTEEQMAQLRLTWIPEFEKVISAKKTAMFFQIDRRLGLMVELKLSSEIPLAKP
jgi:hypothetical protein